MIEGRGLEKDDDLHFCLLTRIALIWVMMRALPFLIPVAWNMKEGGYISRMVINHFLGRKFDRRLYQVLREKRKSCVVLSSRKNSSSDAKKSRAL